jgi:hypothetical protein
MSGFSFMSDTALTNVRMISLVGLLITALTVTLLTILLAWGASALARVIRHALGRNRVAVDDRTSAASSRPQSDVGVPNRDSRSARSAARAVLTGRSGSEMTRTRRSA